MTEIKTHRLTLPGSMLLRGFWLYVLQVKTPQGEVLYVGRTGDSSSPNAGSPIARMGRHLSHNEKQNVLQRHLGKQGIKPENCAAFHLITHGPIYPEAPESEGSGRMEKHKPPRDRVAAMEKALADDLKKVGYRVINEVKSRKILDQDAWLQVRAAFAEHFQKLKTADP